MLSIERQEWRLCTVGGNDHEFEKTAAVKNGIGKAERGLDLSVLCIEDGLDKVEK